MLIAHSNITSGFNIVSSLWLFFTDVNFTFLPIKSKVVLWPSRSRLQNWLISQEVNFTFCLKMERKKLDVINHSVKWLGSPLRTFEPRGRCYIKWSSRNAMGGCSEWYKHVLYLVPCLLLKDRFSCLSANILLRVLVKSLSKISIHGRVRWK